MDDEIISKESADFRNFLLMDGRLFDVLLNKVTPYIKKHNTILHDYISATYMYIQNTEF